MRALDVLELRRRAVLVPQLPAPLPGTVADNVALRPVAARPRRPTSSAASRAPGSTRAYADRDAGASCRWASSSG